MPATSATQPSRSAAGCSTRQTPVPDAKPAAAPANVSHPRACHAKAQADVQQRQVDSSWCAPPCSCMDGVADGSCLLQLVRTRTARRDGMQTFDAGPQAMLEADPTSREPRDSYLARYQAYARDELDQALSKYDQLQSSLGERSCCTTIGQDALQLGRTLCEATANLQQQLGPASACG